MDTKTLINKWKFSQSILAKKLGMTNGAFSLKLRGKYDQSFSQEQEAKIAEHFEEMKEDLSKYLSKTKK